MVVHLAVGADGELMHLLLLFRIGEHVGLPVQLLALHLQDGVQQYPASRYLLSLDGPGAPDWLPLGRSFDLDLPFPQQAF